MLITFRPMQFAKYLFLGSRELLLIRTALSSMVHQYISQQFPNHVLHFHDSNLAPIDYSCIILLVQETLALIFLLPPLIH